ncbi:hypothetical protein ACH40E_33530 [Streptomyces acidicola]|uniref:hypothetical protein n=1 Tax=Streptomyces acidicola TaxID=2596892 RepID=UPI0037A0E79F
MPKVAKQTDFLERLAVVEEQLAALRRAGRERDELPFFPTSQHGLAYHDSTDWTTLWETILSPRTATLALGLILLGDTVTGTNTGGEWQLLFDEAPVATGTVPATFSYVLPALTLDLTPYRSAAQLKVRIQVRRTSGATTGGMFGGGGSIGASPRYARLL